MPTAVPSLVFVPQLNENTVVLSAVQDSVTNVYLGSGAAITATLYDSQGNPVIGASGIALAYIPGSFGDFQGDFGDSNFVPTLGTGYTLAIDGVSSGVSLHMEIPAQVIGRDS